MVSVANDFSKVVYKDPDGRKFCSTRIDEKNTEVKSESDNKVENQSVNQFLNDMSKSDNKIISLERSPETDSVQFSTNKNSDDPNTLSQYKLDNLDKNTEKKQLSYRKYTLKNEDADLEVKGKFFGRQGIQGKIGESDINVTMKPNFFNASKGKITGTIDGQEVSIPFSYDVNRNLKFDDENYNLSDAVKNNLGLIVNQNVKTIDVRNKALMLMNGAMAYTTGDVNDQILFNQMIQNQMLFDQQNMINQQMHQQAINNHMIAMGMM